MGDRYRNHQIFSLYLYNSSNQKKMNIDLPSFALLANKGNQCATYLPSIEYTCRDETNPKRLRTGSKQLELVAQLNIKITKVAENL